MDRPAANCSPARPRADARTLQTILGRLNVMRARGERASSVEAFLHARYRSHHRLAVYGSLAPARRNHHVLEPLGGEWRRGIVRGRYYSSGWGAGCVYPGIFLDEGANGVPVKLLTSALLASQWGRLDAFEGDEYTRLLTVVSVAGGRYTIANIYALRIDPEA